MRIGIDARFFGPKDKGFGRYTENLIRELEKIDNVNEYFIFLRENSWQDYESENPNFHKVPANYRWYGIKEQIFLPMKFKKYNLDLMHFTHFNTPIFYKGRFIVTIH
ncbi:MAG: Glycosyl transferase, group 1, partial [Parcubacteria group bacterium Athens0714_26]